MSQSIVTVRLNGQPYQMGCDAGQEAHIEQLGREVNGVVSELAQSVGQVGEARLLAMAALIIADRKSQKTSKPTPDVDDAASEQHTVSADAELSVEEIEAITEQIEAMTSRIKKLTAHLANLS